MKTRNIIVQLATPEALKALRQAICHCAATILSEGPEGDLMNDVKLLIQSASAIEAELTDEE
jgi:hypothetical protein